MMTKGIIAVAAAFPVRFDGWHSDRRERQWQG